MEACQPIQMPRNPVTLSISLEGNITNNTNVSLSKSNVMPTLSDTRNAISTLVNDNIGQASDLPARMTYEIREINSSEEFNLNLGFGLNFNPIDLSNNFELNSLKYETNIAIIIKQVYYTIDVDTPNDPSWFICRYS